MIKNPLVTIITTTYNIIESKRKDFFIKSIESIHNQTYNNIEHIIIDGGSTDGTLDIIKEYFDKGYINSYISEPDEGIYDAFNKGIKIANGKYIAFLNSDDYYHDTKGIEQTVKYLEKTQADYSYAPCLTKNEEDKITKYFDTNLYRVFTQIPFMQLTMFTKKDVLLDEGLFDFSFKIAADYDLFLKLILNKRKAVYVPYVFATFRSGGVSGNQELTTLDCANIYHKHYKTFYNASIEEYKKIWNKETIPLNLLLGLIKKCGFIFGLGMISYYISKNFRKWLIQIRTKKGQETFRLFGIYFIKPKTEDS